MNLFVVYDKVAEESGPIFEAKNTALAQRQYRQLVARQVNCDPADFRLLRLGSIDHHTQAIRIEEMEDVTPEVDG